MGIVLADSAPSLQNAVDRGVCRRTSGGVLEEPVDPRPEIPETLQGGVRARYPAGRNEPLQHCGRRPDEPAGLQHQSHIDPTSGFVRGVAAAAGFDLDPRAGEDAQPVVRGMAVEEVSPVPPGVQEPGHGTGGFGLEGKLVQPLAPIHQRRNKQGHDGPAHRARVAVFQFVLDHVDRAHAGSPSSTG